MVKLFLGPKDVNPNRPDTDGQTPISQAAMSGQEGAVELLPGQINPDLRDNFGRTPISWAAEHGHEAVVKLLLRREDVNPGRPGDGWCRSPILWAAKNGYGEVVELFMERDTNPNRPDIYGLTVYSYVAIGRDLCRKIDARFEIPTRTTDLFPRGIRFSSFLRTLGFAAPAAPLLSSDIIKFKLIEPSSHEAD